MYLGQFTVPRASRYRLYVHAAAPSDSASAVAVETRTPPSSLTSRLKRLCAPHVVAGLQQCPGTGAAGAPRLEMEFADYLSAVADQRCHCDDRRTVDVSMGTSSHQTLVPGFPRLLESLGI